MNKLSGILVNQVHGMTAGGTIVILSLVKFYGGDSDGVSLQVQMDAGLYTDSVTWNQSQCKLFCETFGESYKHIIELEFHTGRVIVKHVQALKFYNSINESIIQKESNMSANQQSQQSQQTESRPLYVIAREIRREWKNVYFGAVPYLSAMSSLDSINDDYGLDSAKSVVLYFLSNASTWRGETAKRIKKELKAMAGIK